MAFERNEMTGALFTNSKRETDKQPNYTGGVLIGGVDYRLAGWIRTDRNGNKYMSLAATAPEPVEPDVPVPDVPAPAAAADDDIPF